MEPGIAWLTGAASGVGRHLTGAFLDRGWRVLATDLDEAGLAAAARAGWPPERVRLRRLDVRDRDGWEDCYRDLIAAWGGLDLMANIAGYIRPGWLMESARAEIDRHMAINFDGVVNGSLLAARHMTEQGRGRILNVASLAGVAPIPGLGAYSTSKFAVRAFSLALAMELRPLGVHVTVLCPDAIDTPMLDRQVNSDEAALTFSGGRPLSLEEIERTVFARVLPQRPVELLLPTGRGLQARLAGAFPQLAARLLENLRKKGARAQRARRRG
jgi:NAD(P)-dependent dehydrogenase (short-subunit alcohol dehydrogenase family)